MSYEQPPYSVRHRAGPIEYRQYEPYLVAETLVQDAASFDRAGNEGFRRLFNYIAGGNTGRAKIAMTAPVSQTAPMSHEEKGSRKEKGEKIAMTVPVQQAGSGAGWRVAFMLPREYTLDTAPAPRDPRVKVVALPGRLEAVLRYSGRWTERNFTEHRDQLLRGLAAAGVTPAGEPRLARYDAPYTLPFLRRNEVSVEVHRVPDG